MTTNTNTETRKARPAYRLCFSARRGIDQNGQAVLGYPIEIGACFHRREADKGLVAKFQLIPADLKDGVLFLMPVTEADAEAKSARVAQ